MNNLIIFQDNRYITAAQAFLSPFDPGFTYGDGVFETIRLYRGTPFKLDLHQNRLEQGLELLGIPKPPATARLGEIIAHLGSRNHLQNDKGIAKILISRGQDSTGPHLIVLTIPLDSEAIRKRQQGMEAVILPWKRDAKNPLLRIKSINYLENRYGRELALRQGADEGIFLNLRGELCEGTFSNVFLVEKDSLITPPIEAGLLPGITRKVIMECCRLIGIKCREERLKPADIAQFQGGFLSSSLMEIAPLKSLGTHHFIPGKVINVQQGILDAYRQIRQSS